MAGGWRCLLSEPAEIALVGLRVEPYACALGGLGLLRLVTEQRDPEARGWWRNGHFWLSSSLDSEALVRFLVEEYVPTPIVSPWNKTGGFLRVLPEYPRHAIAASAEARFEPYRQRLALVERVMAEAADGWEKEALVRRLRELCPEDLWLSTVVDWQRRRFAFSWLGMAGGVAGKVELSTVFMEALRWLLLAELRPAGRASELLRAALYDEPTNRMAGETHGPFDPRTVSSHAGSDDGGAKSLSNPWSFLLAIEGVVSGAVSAVKHRPGGEGMLFVGEALHDLLVPTWSKPFTLAEVLQTQGGSRFALAQRNGRSFLAVRTGREAVSLDLGALGLWLEEHRPEFWIWYRTSRLRRPALPHAQLLEQIGRLRLHASSAPALAWRADALPLSGDVEFDLALSLASLGRGLHRTLRLRPELWRLQGRDLCERMVKLARYRIWAGQQVPKRPNRAGILLFNDPFWSGHIARPEHLLAFLQGEVDERRLEDLLHALVVVEMTVQRTEPAACYAFLPEPYRLLKAAFGRDTRSAGRRPAPTAVLDALYREQVAKALGLARDFVGGREASDRSPEECGIAGRRLAAAMLFPMRPADLA